MPRSAPDVLSTWLNFSQQMAWASIEAQQVIALRLIKLSQGGPKANREATRMVSEKVAASAEAFTTLAMGGSLDTVTSHYRTLMRANRKRLSKRRASIRPT
jgi:hypothetical protein